MKKVKKSLESSHEYGTNSHFLELANHLPVNMLTLDRQYRYLYFNAAHANTMRDFYGTEISPGSVFTDYISNAALQNLLIQNIDRCFEGEIFETLVTFPRKQGQNDKFRIRFVPAQGENNTVESVSLLFDSGTQYSQGFLPLYNLRPMLEVHANTNNGINEIKDILIRDVFDRLNLGVMIVYPEKFSVLYANNALVGYLDLPCNDLSNIKLTDLDQFSLEKTQEKIRSSSREKGEPFSISYISLDGTVNEFEIYSWPILYESKNATLLVFQDVTAQRRAEEANRLQSNLIDRVEQAVIVTDLDGKITFWNRFAETLYGWKASEATGKNIVQLLTYDLTNEQEEGIKQQLRQGKSWNGEYPVKRKNGQLFQAYVNQVPFFNPQGELIGVIGVSFDNSERRQRDFELETIVSISSALRIAETAEEMDEIIIDKVVSLLNVDAASVEIVDPVTKDSEYKAAFGPWKSMEGYVQPHGTGLNAIIERTLRPYQTDNIETDPNLAYMRNLYPNLRGAAGLPMIAKDELIGFLWIARVTELFTNDVKLASSISEIAANAIRRSRLHENVQQLLFSLNEAYDTTLQGWADALELRDQETMGHSRRVVEMTVRLARKIGVPESDIPDIRRGTILHDIGKMGVPDAILRKPGPLNAEEWEIMRQHPVYAYKLLEPIKYLSKAIDIPYCHHEKWDGRGYPRGLKGEEIPLPARIFAVVDVWDALSSERPYKKAWSIDEVKQYLKENSGLHFDPKIVPAFLELLAEIEETKGISEEKA